MPSSAGQNAQSKRRLIFGICAALTLITWIVFGQTVRHDFVNFDDDKYVYDEPHVTHGLTLEDLKWALTHSHSNLWHPLTTISHMFDCQLYGLRAGGHHFTNVVLQNIAVVLLFFVLCQLMGSIWQSGFVAAIFAIHPLRVESVAWIAERKDVLSGVFFMLTLGAYLRYARAPSISRYFTMSILFVSGLMSKATFVTVPFVLLLLDYWPLRRATEPQTWRRLVVEKIPLLVLSVAASVPTFLAQTVTIPSLEQLPLLPRIKNALMSVVIYIKQMFWPVDLAVFYPHPHDQLNLWLVLVSAIIIIIITSAAIIVRKRYPYFVVGWFWYLVLLAPVLGLIQAGLQARADRFTYLPSIGITIAVTCAISDLTARWRNRGIVLGAVATFVISSLMVCAWHQTTFWRDSIILWEHALAVTSNNQTAHQNLAAALWARDRKDEASEHLRSAGIIHWQTVLKDYPFDNAARDELGTLLIQSGNPRDAIEQWEMSLRIKPDDGNAQNNLAWVLATYPDSALRDGKRAVQLAESAANLPGGDAPIVLRTLAAAYAEHGDFSKAIETNDRALRNAETQKNSSLAETLRHELSLYEVNKPYREMPQQ